MTTESKRALTGLIGLALIAAGLACYDWRVACIVVGALTWIDAMISTRGESR